MNKLLLTTGLRFESARIYFSCRKWVPRSITWGVTRDGQKIDWRLETCVWHVSIFHSVLRVCLIQFKPYRTERYVMADRLLCLIGTAKTRLKLSSKSLKIVRSCVSVNLLRFMLLFELKTSPGVVSSLVVMFCWTFRIAVQHGTVHELQYLASCMYHWWMYWKSASLHINTRARYVLIW
jgi:hypothetical protein